MTDAALHKVLAAWNGYIQDMRPETRNDFLRTFALYVDDLRALAAQQPVVDVLVKALIAIALGDKNPEKTAMKALNWSEVQDSAAPQAEPTQFPCSNGDEKELA